MPIAITMIAGREMRIEALWDVFYFRAQEKTHDRREGKIGSSQHVHYGRTIDFQIKDWAGIYEPNRPDPATNDHLFQRTTSKKGLLVNIIYRVRNRYGP